MNSSDASLDESDEILAELLTLTMSVDAFGTTTYRNHLGQRHRIHGPAVFREDGWVLWYKNNNLHRMDGPAMCYPSGIVCWFINGDQLTEEEFNEQVKSI